MVLIWDSKKYIFLKILALRIIKVDFFFLGLVICVFVYFVFNNYYYREIFLFFIIPYMLIKKDDYSIIKFVIYFLLARHLFFLMSNYLYLNSYLTDNFIYLLPIKAFLDLFLISILLGMLLAICINLINSNIKKLKIWIYQMKNIKII